MAGTTLGNWLAVRSKKKKIRHLQELIDDPNEGLEIIRKQEKKFLEEAAKELEESEGYGGKYRSVHLERKHIYDERARYLANMQEPGLVQLVLLERLKKKEMEALEDIDFPTKATTMHLCFHF